ncbi:hypothetical protein H9633_10975 [Microbacterium sp. Re1]|uniref:Uncharacterized protein n=1 Tax=Microbacterium commune TaxID=2762219 RepID=A0ABR8W728_9MICO|nr:hypothetical protein [Microbacterium commune]MBD8012819.1 hypothetical protein [Microbacterium commune]
MNTSNQNDRHAEQLARDTRRAKRAPEIAAWLRLGPLYLPEVIALRRDRLMERGRSLEEAESYASSSVMWDLHAVAGVGGPVRYVDGLLWLNEDHRAAIDAWVREDVGRGISFAPGERDAR